VWLPIFLAPLIDLSFLLVLGGIIAREIIAGKNWRNLPILALVVLLTTANAIFHFEAINGTAFDGYGIRMGLGVIIFLISLSGGRVIPSFTRNWLARRTPGRLPSPMNRYDLLTLGLSGVTIIAWIITPETIEVRILTTLAGLLHLIRLVRWAGERTFSEPLVTILHIGYLFVPIGFLMIGIGDMLPGWGRAAQIPHAWSAGAVGVMTLAMMTRVSLGHSGRPLTATASITAIYAAVILAVLLRILAEMLPTVVHLLHMSATAWIIGFAGFAIVYFPILTRPKD
jgi:uncharacterized protein involved in response to NO